MSANNDEKDKVEIAVPSKDPKKKANRKENGKIKKSGELTDEDKQIKEEVNLTVQRCLDSDLGIAATALQMLSTKLRTATGTVGSVPKPLKFVRPLFDDLVRGYNECKNEANRKAFCDLLSFIAMTMEEKETRAVLKYRLKGNLENIAVWGHEYLRFIAGDIAQEWDYRTSNPETEDVANTSELEPLMHQIMTYMMAHQDEGTACDLALDTNNLEMLLKHCDEHNYTRVAQYIVAVSQYLLVPENYEALEFVYNLYVKFKSYVHALRIALRLFDQKRVEELFKTVESYPIKLQMAFICARHRVFIDLEDDKLNEVIGNNGLSEFFLHSAGELDSLAPKNVQDIYKSYLVDPVPLTVNDNLATLFVNAFANCAYKKDGIPWNVNETFMGVLNGVQSGGKMSGTATIGLINLWDHNGISFIDSFSYSDDPDIRAGAMLATGLIMCGVKSIYNTVMALLGDHTTGSYRASRIGAILGMGFGYAGMCNEEVKENLLPLIADADQSVEIQAIASFALALIYPSTCDEDISSAIMSTLLELNDAQLQDPSIRYLTLALGVIFLGRQEKADILIEGTQALSPIIQKYTEVIVISCAYAATGNVIQIQKLFALVAEAEEAEEAEEEERENERETEENTAPSTQPSDLASLLGGASNLNSASPGGATTSGLQNSVEVPSVEDKTRKSKVVLNYKAAAVLGVGTIIMGEEYGTEMVKRSLIHVLMADHMKKDDKSMSGRLAVPLAYAMLTISTPDMHVIDTLHKMSHDGDISTAMSAILGMGIVGAGTNNARIATMLRNLTGYYSKDSNALFMVRIAQGLTALGKGHLTIQPLHSDKFLFSPCGLAGILGLVHSALDLTHTLLDKYSFMLYSFAPALNPRMMLTVDVNLIPVKCSARLGMPVDTVTVPGKPKAITGFQTQNTPLLMNSDERADIVGKHKAFTPIVENIVVVEEKKEQD